MLFSWAVFLEAGEAIASGYLYNTWGANTHTHIYIYTHTLMLLEYPQVHKKKHKPILYSLTFLHSYITNEPSVCCWNRRGLYNFSKALALPFWGRCLFGPWPPENVMLVITQSCPQYWILWHQIKLNHQRCLTW